MDTLTLAYMVEYRSDLYGQKRKLFQHHSLLMARKAAIAHAEAQLEPDDLFDAECQVDVYLVELESDNDPNPTIIARIFQNFLDIDEDFEEFITNGYTPEQTLATKEYYKRVLIQLQRELEYYLVKKLPVGLGVYDVAIRLDHKPYPINHITFLFDAMSYGMAAISLYNSTGGVTYAIVFATPGQLMPITPILDK